MERYAFAAFRSRQAVLRYEEQLNREGIKTQIITTPRAAAMGCGLSVRFQEEWLQEAIRLCRMQPCSSLIGFFEAEEAGGRIRITPVRV